MILLFIIIGLLIVSVLLSYYSLKKDMQKLQHIEDVQKDLKKGKVLFYSSSSSES